MKRIFSFACAAFLALAMTGCVDALTGPEANTGGGESHNTGVVGGGESHNTGVVGGGESHNTKTATVGNQAFGGTLFSGKLVERYRAIDTGCQTHNDGAAFSGKLVERYSVAGTCLGDTGRLKGKVFSPKLVERYSVAVGGGESHNN